MTLQVSFLLSGRVGNPLTGGSGSAISSGSHGKCGEVESLRLIGVLSLLGGEEVERYKVTLTPGMTRWGIIDRELMDWCSLPDSENPDQMKYLEWFTKWQAEDWLAHCYSTWEKWESVKAETPSNWHPLPMEPYTNPFDSDRWEYNR